MTNINKMLIYNNMLYFYNYKTAKVEVFDFIDGCLKENKIFDSKLFVDNLRTINDIRKINNKLVGESLKFIYWSNYSEVDKKIVVDIFNDLNFSHISLVNIKELFTNNLPSLVITCDGVYYINDITSYFNYISHNDSIVETVDFIKKKYKINKYILIGECNGVSLQDNDAYLYENHKTIFHDLLKNMD